MNYYIDIDEVIMNFSGIMSDVCPDYNPNTWQLSEKAQKFHDDNMPFIYWYMKPFVTEVKAIEEITYCTSNNCYLLTARDSKLKNITEKSLRMYGIENKVFFSDNKIDFIEKREENLSEVILIDDKPETIKEALAKGIEAYLFRRAHNSKELLPSINSIWEII